MEEKKRFQKFPNVIILLIGIVLIMTILTYIIPAGAYEREVNDAGRTVVVNGTFQFLDEQTPVGLMDFLSAFHNGFLNGADIIMLVLACGGSFAVLNSSRAIEALLGRLCKILGSKKSLVVPIIMFAFAFGGGAISIYEECLPFVPILVAFALSLGFDSLTGASMVILGLSTGFSAAFMSPVVVGTAQHIAGLELLSGMWYRCILFAVMAIASCGYMFFYARRVDKNPEMSAVYEVDKARTNISSSTDDLVEMTTSRAITLIVLLLTFVILGYGVMKLGWWYAEITGCFMGLGFATAIVNRMHYNEFADEFLKGLSDIAGAAMVICFAQAVLVVMTQGNILDTILYSAASVLENFPPLLCAIGMYIFQCLVNFVVPSGTGQAVLTMPVLAPLASLTGVTLQTSVLCFQLGDGISNALTPCCGFLMMALGVAGIPFEKWVKFVWKFLLMQYAIGAVFIIIAQCIGLQ